MEQPLDRSAGNDVGNDVKLSYFLQINIIDIGGIRDHLSTTKGRIAVQGKGLFFLKYLCVCCGKRKYCMGLATFGCDRIYAPAKERLEKERERIQAADLPFRLNQFSLFITGNCFSISLPIGNISTFGLRRMS